MPNIKNLSLKSDGGSVWSQVAWIGFALQSGKLLLKLEFIQITYIVGIPFFFTFISK